MTLCNEKLLKLKGNLTLDTISKKTRIDKAIISKYCNGYEKTPFKPDSIHAELLAEYFDVAIDYIFDDNIPILDNPQEKYPYKTKEQRNKEVSDKIKSLEKDLASYSSCDENFKNDVKILLEKSEKSYANLKKHFNEKTDDPTINKEIIKAKMALIELLITRFQSISKLNYHVDKIKDFINKKDGKGLYTASKALFELIKYYENFDKLIIDASDFINEFYEASMHLDSFESIVSPLEDEILNLKEKLLNYWDELAIDEKSNNDKIKEIYKIFNSSPISNHYELYIFWALNHYRSINYHFNKDYNISIEFDFLKEQLKSWAYQNNEFFLEQTDDTLENLYTHSYNFVFNKFDITNYINEFKEKSNSWINLVNQKIKEWGI